MFTTQKPLDPLRKDSMDVAPAAALHSAKPVPLVRQAPLAGGRDGLRVAPPTKALPSRMITKMLERKCLKHIDAVHHRDFFEDGDIWFDKVEQWEAEMPSITTETMSLTQYVEAWQVLARKYPSYGIHCTDMSTTMRDGIAEVYVNLEVTGMPTGVIRKNTSIATFALLDGKWLATKFKTLPS